MISSGLLFSACSMGGDEKSYNLDHIYEDITSNLNELLEVSGYVSKEEFVYVLWDAGYDKSIGLLFSQEFNQDYNLEEGRAYKIKGRLTYLDCTKNIVCGYFIEVQTTTLLLH